MLPMTDREDRFWNKVRIGDWCWEWTGFVDRLGYGITKFEGSDHKAHRVSWATKFGQMPPDGVHVLHRCDNRKCVRPSHLFLGTHQDNMNDMVAKKRHAHGETHYSCKLTEATVLEIRRRGGEGEAAPDMAREFNVTPRTVYQILRRETWRHV